jgi:hypothetical protein
VKGISELLRLIRVGQCRLSVAYHLGDLERAKTGLAKSYDALDRAEAELAIHETEPTVEPPVFLRVKK